MTENKEQDNNTVMRHDHGNKLGITNSATTELGWDMRRKQGNLGNFGA